MLSKVWNSTTNTHSLSLCSSIKFDLFYHILHNRKRRNSMIKSCIKSLVSLFYHILHNRKRRNSMIKSCIKSLVSLFYHILHNRKRRNSMIKSRIKSLVSLRRSASFDFSFLVEEIQDLQTPLKQTKKHFQIFKTQICIYLQWLSLPFKTE